MALEQELSLRLASQQLGWQNLLALEHNLQVTWKESAEHHWQPSTVIRSKHISSNILVSNITFHGHWLILNLEFCTFLLKSHIEACYSRKKCRNQAISARTFGEPEALIKQDLFSKTLSVWNLLKRLMILKQWKLKSSETYMRSL